MKSRLGAAQRANHRFACHLADRGRDNVEKRRTTIYPHAPALLPSAKGVTDDEVGETHWVVENGIRFSGMPSFEGALSKDELWQVSVLLRNADKLPVPVQDMLRK